MRRVRLSRALFYFWLFILAVIILVSAQTAYRKSVNTEEYAYACDAFGYLRMAKEIRQGAHQLKFPEFKLESPQTRLLVNFMQSQKVPLPLWEEVVAPHAHHYFPESGYVGVQYPPGTGLTLAMFPEGKAVYGLNRMVVLFFLLIGIVALFIAALKEAWASAGLITLAICLGLSILGRLGALSFSINAMFIPLLLGCILAVAAWRLNIGNRSRLAWFTAFGTGLCLGFATLIRLPIILLVPGFLVLFWPNSWRVRIKSLPFALILGVFLTGVFPVLLYQQAIAGAWYLPSYSKADAALPTVARLSQNFSYYLGNGPGAEDNWALLCAFVGFSGFVLKSYLTSGPQISTRSELSWKRVGLAVFIVWLVPTVFFLSHGVAIPYYTIPGTFGAVALMGLVSAGIEVTSASHSTKKFNKRRALWWLALALVLWPGIETVKRTWAGRPRTTDPARAVAHAPVVLPPELADGRAWVWADLLTGTFWYYADKPAFKIQFTNSETRAMIFKFVSDRGERQYLIQDSERMQQFMDEIIQWGGTLEPRGKVDGQPYFLIRWPQGGPLATNVASTN